MLVSDSVVGGGRSQAARGSDEGDGYSHNLAGLATSPCPRTAQNIVGDGAGEVGGADWCGGPCIDSGARLQASQRVTDVHLLADGCSAQGIIRPMHLHAVHTRHNPRTILFRGVDRSMPAPFSCSASACMKR